MASSEGYDYDYSPELIPRPLIIRRPPSPDQAAGPIFPVRSSSIPASRIHQVQARYGVLQTQNDRINSQVASIVSGSSSSTANPPPPTNRSSDHTSARGSATTASRHSMSDTHTSRFRSPASSGLMGDFIPFESPNMNFAAEHRTATNITSKVSSGYGKIINPYEFDPDSPYVKMDRQTTFSDFIKSGAETSSISPRTHKKNSRSEGNALLSIPASPPSAPLPQLRGQRLHRSESSPSVVPAQFAARHQSSPNPDIARYYYGEEDESVSANHRGRQTATVHGRQMGASRDVQTPVRNERHEHHRQPDSRSPTRSQHQSYTKQAVAQSASVDRRRARSPAKTLDYADDQYEQGDSETFHEGPKKRSRSPMKKMFGERGWLSRSPMEPNDTRKFTPRHSLGKEDSSKKTVMGKIRSKLEEFAEKADMSPVKVSKSPKDKDTRHSMLRVSMGPSEQARVYTDIELMLVTTANKFLMRQFSQGRVSVDTIKKTVDLWKSKGRPNVTEFMYDQATQRDLIAANQHNFLFHGERAGDGIRVNSMLYNWKNVASLMAIRTFCNADTIILKLLFDSEQILELLGASEVTLFHLQQIRASVNQILIAARKNDTKTASYPIENARGDLRGMGQAASQAMSDPYGGMKLVPDTYTDRA